MQYAAAPVAFYFHQAFGGACKPSEALGIKTPLTLYVYAPDVDAIYQHSLDAGRISRMVSDNMFRSERCCQLGGIDSYRCEISRQQENVRPAGC
jgi:hypothetical protein